MVLVQLEVSDQTTAKFRGIKEQTQQSPCIACKCCGKLKSTLEEDFLEMPENKSFRISLFVYAPEEASTSKLCKSGKQD